MNKEEIIRRLKKISEHAVHVIGEPPFIMSLDDGIALNEAVRLLKEQEAVEPKRIDGKRNHFIQCGNCNYDLLTGYLFCPHCGKAVKWNG